MYQFLKRPLSVIYIASFFFAIHLALTAYANSSYLHQYIPEKFIVVIYAIGSLLGIFSLIHMPKILRKIGNHKFITTAILTSTACLIGLNMLQTPYLIIPVFILYITSNSAIIFSLDVFIENYSDDVSTGKIRGLYLTTINLAWILSPLVSGAVISSVSYQGVYALAAVFMIPVFFLLFYRFRNFTDSPYEEISIKETFKNIIKDKNIRKVSAVSFMLQFFYVVMVLYTPIYLHEHLGYGWDSIGVIFTIMLLPFALLQFPLGKIADKVLGEKEIMSAGFIIMGLSTIAITFLPKDGIILWAAILFITRIGASAVEVMSETYFFKKIRSGDAPIISFYRSMPPTAYVIAPLFVVPILWLFPYHYIFLALGLVMFLGLIFSLRIEDTK